MSARLAQWLGPWTDDDLVPRHVSWRPMVVPAEAGRPEMDVWVYSNGAPTGAMVVTPGLHYLGPADCRLDRFCRVLAEAGILVVCPFLPDFRRMQVTHDLGVDLERALDLLLALPERRSMDTDKVGLFSISFGSLPALDVAARRPEVGRLMLFGGFAVFRDTLEFAVEGAPDGRAHDPLNCCAVLLNFVEHLDPKNAPQLRQAWMDFIRLTWGRPYMKSNEAFAPVAHRLAEDLADRELFLKGTRVLPGVHEMLEQCLEGGRARIESLDPLPDCARIAIPTVVAHGRDDDVIPWEQGAALAQAIPHAELFITGAYSHTGQSTVLDLVPTAAREVRALVGIVGGMAKTSRP